MRTPAVVWIGSILRKWTCAVAFCAQAQTSAPELPQVHTADFLPSIRTQIEQAETEARAHPTDGKSVGMLAMTLHAYQQYDAAAQAYSRAHALEPQDFEWLYLGATAQMELGAFEDAVKSFRSALRLRPGYVAAQLRLALSLTAVPRWNDAEEVYRSILNGHGDCPQAWYGLGRVQTARGDHAGAAQSYSKACDLFPAYGAAHFALAAELRRLGRQNEAEQHLVAYSHNVTAEPPLDDPLLRRILELNHGTQAHMQRAAALEKSGQFDEATRENEAALAIDPTNVQTHVNLIGLYGRKGDSVNAKQHFEAAIKLDPGRPDAWYDYGVLLLRGKNTSEAQEAFQHALRINPNYAEAHTNLGVIYEQEGRLDDAASEFRAAIAAQPNYPLARFHLGRILVNQEKYDEAIRQFRRALTPEDEQTTVVLYALGAAYARAGDREHALEYIRKAHDAALERGQSQLLTGIDRDLNSLGKGR